MPDLPRISAIVPCNDLDAAEAWWLRLGFTRLADQDYDGYRILADDDCAEIHISTATPDWLVPGRNPFGVYVYTPRVEAVARAMREAMIEAGRRPEHKPWGMYEFALNGPDDLLVRVGWPSQLIRAS